MQVSKQKFDQIIKEEIEKMKNEGLLDFIKGSGSAAANMAAKAGKSAMGTVGKAASSLGQGAKDLGAKVKSTATDISNAGHLASKKAEKEKLVQRYNQDLVRIQNQLKQLARVAAQGEDTSKEEMALNMAQKLYDLVMVPGEEIPADVPEMGMKKAAPAPIQGLNEKKKK